MNWRNVFVNALITLGIAVVAGVLVYFLTKGPSPPSESLAYTLNTSAAFGSDQDKITFLTISLQNTGTKAARNVRIAGKFDRNSVIQDRRITLSAGPAAIFRDESSAALLAVFIPSLAPAESAEISLLVKGANGSAPDIGVQSDDSMATQILPPSLEAKTEGLSKMRRILIVLVAALALVLQLILIRFGPFRGFLRRIIPSFLSLNNAAFVYLQIGLTDAAKELLKAAIAAKGADPITFANYGLALGLTGDTDLGSKHMDAAFWWAATNHEKAVVEYDRAILSIHLNDVEGAKRHLRKAFALSPREITRYCQLSTYLQAGCKQDSELNSIVTKRGR
jgi:tetratricopeptide (TPR) repeat protein